MNHLEVKLANRRFLTSQTTVTDLASVISTKDMKNVQIIDRAQNCVYDIFEATSAEFSLIFPVGTDVAFIDEVYANGIPELLDIALNNIWQRRLRKIDVVGIHGILFYELGNKKAYYPTRSDEEAVNPDGSELR